MLHSFTFPETIKAFNGVTQTDPACAIAYWGLAVSNRPNPLVGPWDAATLKRLDLTGYILRNVLPQAQADISEAEQLNLSERDSLRVLELLEPALGVFTDQWDAGQE